MHYPKCRLFIYTLDVNPVTGKYELESDYRSSCEYNRMVEFRCNGKLFEQRQSKLKTIMMFLTDLLSIGNYPYV